MWAGASADANASTVSLTFHPLFTAFEFIVGGDDAADLTLESFTLSSSSCALSGNFTAQIAQGGGSKSYSSIPSRIASSNDVLTYTFPSGSDAVTINSTNLVRFTVLTLPARNLSGSISESLSDLTIKFWFKVNGGSTVTRSLVLKKKNETTPMVFDGTKKYRISNLNLPSLKEATFSVEVIDYETVNSDLGFGNVDVSDMSDSDGNDLDFVG
jgi:hypothetical protein